MIQKTSKKTQLKGSDLFIETAKRLGCEESEASFEGNLKRIAKSAPQPMPKKARKK